MVLLICFAFVVQAMASTLMPYHMMSIQEAIGQEQSQNVSTMENCGHNMAEDPTSDTSEASSDDCCQKYCNCFTGGCSSITALIKDVSNEPIESFSAKIHSISNLALSQQLTSPYRPPILS